MGKLRQTALILGEGPTEFFYFKSLCDVFKRLTIKPDYPKHTNIKELSLKLIAAQNCSSSIISATPHVHTASKSHYLKDLNQCVEYRKTIEFFIKTKGFHGYFERNGGSLDNAMTNANRSMDEKLKSGRDYTYSEPGRLLKRLGNL